MTPNLHARKANLIRAHEKALGLKVNSATTNGMLQLDVEDLEHGFSLVEGELRLSIDPVSAYLFGIAKEFGELEELDYWAGEHKAIQSLKKFYRNAGCSVQMYLDHFRTGVGQ